MNSTVTQDMRLKLRAKLLEQGVKRPILKISASDSKKASIDSIKLVSGAYTRTDDWPNVITGEFTGP